MSARSLSAIAKNMAALKADPVFGAIDHEGEAAVLLAEALSVVVDIAEGDGVAIVLAGPRVRDIVRLLASYEALARSMGWRT